MIAFNFPLAILAVLFRRFLDSFHYNIPVQTAVSTPNTTALVVLTSALYYLYKHLKRGTLVRISSKNRQQLSSDNNCTTNLSLRSRNSSWLLRNLRGSRNRYTLAIRQFADQALESVTPKKPVPDPNIGKIHTKASDDHHPQRGILSSPNRHQSASQSTSNQQQASNNLQVSTLPETFSKQPSSHQHSSNNQQRPSHQQAPKHHKSSRGHRVLGRKQGSSHRYQSSHRQAPSHQHTSSHQHCSSHQHSTRHRHPSSHQHKSSHQHPSNHQKASSHQESSSHPSHHQTTSDQQVSSQPHLTTHHQTLSNLPSNHQESFSDQPASQQQTPLDNDTPDEHRIATCALTPTNQPENHSAVPSHPQVCQCCHYQQNNEYKKKVSVQTLNPVTKDASTFSDLNVDASIAPQMVDLAEEQQNKCSKTASSISGGGVRRRSNRKKRSPIHQILSNVRGGIKKRLRNGKTITFVT